MRGDRASARTRRGDMIIGLLLVVALVAGCGRERRAVAVPDLRPPVESAASGPDTRDVSGESSTIAPIDRTSPTTDATAAPGASVDPTSPIASPTSAPSTTSTSTTTSTTTTSTTSTSTTTTSTTLPAPDAPSTATVDGAFPATNDAFETLSHSNAAASITVVRGGEVVGVVRASGRTLDGTEATGDTPMVVASVSKLVVAIGIARLAGQGRIDIAAPVPWADLGFAPHPAWADVTVRELLDHRSGLATERSAWFTGEGNCRSYVATLLSPPPNGDRGRWVYSNGNYCLLGLLVEQISELPLDVALQILVFDPIGADGIHLTDGGLRPGDVPHAPGIERLSRLGGAGMLVVSTDDLAMMLGRGTDADRAVLQAPGVFTDQYGYGHTGTVSGAKSCVWVLESGSTVVAATIAGDSVATGGDVCDRVVPGVATDIGVGAGRPQRTP